MTREEELEQIKKYIKENGTTKGPYIEEFPTPIKGRGRRRTLKSVKKGKVKK